MKDVSASGDPVGKGGKGGGVSSSSSSSRKMQAPSSGKRDEDWRDETKTEEEGLDTQDGYLLQHGGAAGVPDDKLLMVRHSLDHFKGLSLHIASTLSVYEVYRGVVWACG